MKRLRGVLRLGGEQQTPVQTQVNVVMGMPA